MTFPGGASCPVCGGPAGECQEKALEQLMGIEIRKAGQGMAGQPEYRSTERVYNVDSNGEIVSLKYAVGDLIDEDEARRQGLVKGKARTPAGSVEDKAVRAPAEKPATTKKAAAKPAAKKATAAKPPAATEED